MGESLPFSILGTGNRELYLGGVYGLTQLMSENSVCDEQACLGKEFVPGEWDVVSLQWDCVCLLAPFYFSILFQSLCNSLCSGTCFCMPFNRSVEEEKAVSTTSEIVVFGS